jgi:hypothetical protein
MMNNDLGINNQAAPLLFVMRGLDFVAWQNGALA